MEIVVTLLSIVPVNGMHPPVDDNNAAWQKFRLHRIKMCTICDDFLCLDRYISRKNKEREKKKYLEGKYLRIHQTNLVIMIF